MQSLVDILKNVNVADAEMYEAIKLQMINENNNLIKEIVVEEEEKTADIFISPRPEEMSPCKEEEEDKEAAVGDRDETEEEELDEEELIRRAIELSMKEDEEEEESKTKKDIDSASSPPPLMKVNSISHIVQVVEEKVVYIPHPIMSTPLYISQTLLLRTLQDSLLGDTFVVNKGDISTSTSVAFDPSKRASCTILSDNFMIATQKDEKIWGTTISRQKCLLNSGKYTWDFQIRKCQKGHIFIGVSTADALIPTYLGGDANGWGLIGTKALWFNRQKIKSGYGKRFKDGDVVRMVLDTDAGTLSYGDKEGDWGIAFTGLTSAKGPLYPAVALYQATDAVSIRTSLSLSLYIFLSHSLYRSLSLSL